MKNPKTLLAVSIVCFATISVLLPSLAFCAAAPAQTRPKHWPATMTIATADPGTSGQIVAIALGKLIEERLGIRATVSVSGPEERLRLVAKGEADIGITINNTMLYNAVRGLETFSKDGKQPVRYISYVYQLMLHIIARADSGIKKIPDLRGKRFAYLYRGSSGLYVIPALLEYHKLKPQDVIGLKTGTAVEGFNAMLTGSADASTRSAAPSGTAGIKDAAFSHDLVFLSQTQAEIDYVIAKYPRYGQHTLAPGIYKGQNYPVLNIADGFYGIVHKDMPEDLAYAIAKILLDTCGPNTSGEFTKYHPDLNWTLDQQQSGLSLSPMHPGVVKYLKERKSWTAKMEQAQQNILKIAK